MKERRLKKAADIPPSKVNDELILKLQNRVGTGISPTYLN